MRLTELLLEIGTYPELVTVERSRMPVAILRNTRNSGKGEQIMKLNHILLATSLAFTGAAYAQDEPDNAADRESQRSEEHTSELQSRENLVCRLLLEKKKKQWSKAVNRISVVTENYHTPR